MPATIRVRAARRIEHDQVVHEAGVEFELDTQAAAALLACGAAVALADTISTPTEATEIVSAPHSGDGAAAAGDSAPASTNPPGATGSGAPGGTAAKKRRGG